MGSEIDCGIGFQCINQFIYVEQFKRNDKVDKINIKVYGYLKP